VVTLQVTNRGTKLIQPQLVVLKNIMDGLLVNGHLEQVRKWKGRGIEKGEERGEGRERERGERGGEREREREERGREKRGREGERERRGERKREREN
jgi:hypothetical protein